MDTNRSIKRRYLAVYDYGTGGVWCFIYAQSADQIEKQYPELKVIHDEPDWLKGDYRSQIEKRTFDIDDKPTGLLRDIVDARQKLRKP